MTRIEAAARAIEVAARAICEADPLSPAPDAPITWGMKPAKAWEPRAAIIRRAIEMGLFCHPAKSWIAPNEATEGMRFAAWKAMKAGETDMMAPMRDAYLKDHPE